MVFLDAVLAAHGFDRPAAHVTYRRPRPPGSKLLPLHLWPSAGNPAEDALAAWQKDMNAARRAFESTYGLAGRLRGRLIQQIVRVRDLVRRLSGRDRLVFPFAAMAVEEMTDLPPQCRGDRGYRP